MASNYNTQIKHLMINEVVTVPSGSSIKQAAMTMKKYKVGCLLIVKSEKPIGIITERQFVSMVSGQLNINSKNSVDKIMTKNVITLPPSASVAKAISLIHKKSIKRIPVVLNGQLVGIVSFRELLAHSRDNLIIISKENKKLFIEATHDSLTGLYNKKHFLKQMKWEFSRCKRYGVQSSLIFFDLDHFKKVNDTYSHTAGDYVLKKKIGEILRKNTRQSDTVARYGGEEFVIIIPSTRPGKAGFLADKIRKKIMEYHFQYKSQTIPVTISGGVAPFLNTKNYKEIIEKADKALYKAKARGRNRICRWRYSESKIIDAQEML